MKFHFKICGLNVLYLSKYIHVAVKMFLYNSAPFKFQLVILSALASILTIWILCHLRVYLSIEKSFLLSINYGVVNGAIVFMTN